MKYLITQYSCYQAIHFFTLIYLFLSFLILIVLFWAQEFPLLIKAPQNFVLIAMMILLINLVLINLIFFRLCFHYRQFKLQILRFTNVFVIKLKHVVNHFHFKYEWYLAHMVGCYRDQVAFQVLSFLLGHFDILMMSKLKSQFFLI